MVNTIEQKLAEKKEMKEVLCKQVQDLQAQLNEYQRYITEFEIDMMNPVFAIGVGVAEGVDWVCAPRRWYLDAFTNLGCCLEPVRRSDRRPVQSQGRRKSDGKA